MLWTDLVYLIHYLGWFLLIFGVVFSGMKCIGISDVTWTKALLVGLVSSGHGICLLALSYDMGVSA